MARLCAGKHRLHFLQSRFGLGMTLNNFLQRFKLFLKCDGGFIKPIAGDGNLRVQSALFGT